jgi:hypothetical protein
MNNNEENRNSTREYITITIEQSNNVEENNSEGIDIESQYVSTYMSPHGSSFSPANLIRCP